MGFELSPYNARVANKIINGKQCTILWYGDGSKIAHVDSNVVSDVMQKIEECFGKMTVTRGKQLVFLRMKFVFNDNGTISISTRPYLQEAIKESNLQITFEVDETSPKLSKVEAEVFHSVVAKLLYMSLRSRPDIVLAIGFLCTRVSKSTVQDQ
jgi:hypothetical protein